MSVAVAGGDRSWARGLALVLLGPALVGACLGLTIGPAGLLSRAALLPVLLVGVMALMLPALFIGAAYLGVAPGSRAVVGAAGGALRDMGIILLGLAPPLAFLVVASTHVATPGVLGSLVVGFGATLGCFALYRRLFAKGSMRAALLFLCWALVSFGIGSHLFGGLLALSSS